MPPESPRPRRKRPRGLRRQRGFTMALLLALIAAMGILLGRAIPVAATEVQRSNEAELVFRGEAIADALRIYKAKFGKYPTTLDDLMKVKPRILRKVYKDPMTKSGEWDYVFEVQPGATGGTKGLPIVGVRSHSEKDSLRIYQNKTLYHDWIFSADPNVLGQPGGGKGLPGDPGGLGGGGKGGDSGAPGGGPGGKGGGGGTPPVDKP